MNLKQKLLLIIMTTLITVLLIFAFIVYRQSADTIEQNYVNSVNSGLNVSAATFDDMMREAYFAAVNAANTSELTQLIQKKDNAGIEKLLLNYLGGNVDSIYCYIYGQAQLVRASTQGALTQRCTSDEIVWIQHLAKNSINPLMPVSVTDQLGTVHKQVFLYEQPVISVETGKTIGYIIATVDERIVYFKCLQGNQLSLHEKTYLTSMDGRYASCANLNKLGQMADSTGGDELKTSVQASLTGYSFHSVVNRNVITQDVLRAQSRILIIVLALIVLSCIPAWIVVRNTINPLQRLEGAMDRVGQGDLSARAEIYHEDEVGRLSRGFNHMVGELNHLIDELVTQKMLKREAEIEALQYQIQPHFIYNTLNSIKCAAVLQNAKEIAELLEAFIQLMQLTASDRGAFIPLNQELHMVENYVKLQMFRYANSFEVQYDIMPDTRKCYVPALLLQPIVENAILHGIDPKRSDGLIQIGAMQINGVLAIRIRDNGRGLSAEKLQELMSKKNHSKFSGIGIGNIKERLALYYHRKAELKYYSEIGHGTTAIITLPISHDENEYTI